MAKAKATKPPAPPADSEKSVIVAATAPLYEDGNRYDTGDTFATTPERAAALGELVTPAPDQAI